MIDLLNACLTFAKHDYHEKVGQSKKTKNNRVKEPSSNK